MELAIVHDKGWTCSITGKYDFRLDYKATPFVKYDQVRSDDYFNVVGELQKDDEVVCIVDGLKGWNCKIIGLSKKTLVMDKYKELTPKEIKDILLKIKKHGSTR